MTRIVFQTKRQPTIKVLEISLKRIKLKVDDAIITIEDFKPFRAIWGAVARKLRL